VIGMNKKLRRFTYQNLEKKATKFQKGDVLKGGKPNKRHCLLLAIELMVVKVSIII